MKLLIIGDLNGQIGVACSIATKRGAAIAQVGSIVSALEHVRDGKGADAIMIDVEQPIKQLADSLLQEHINLPVIACGTKHNATAAANAIKDGALEYVPLPPDEELIAAVFEAITREDHTFICQSAAMKQVVEIANQVAPTEANVLITGPSGSGKEVLSKYIHQHSKRRDRDLVSVNCAAIPANLLESELFGHEKGAFTGAVARRIGKFEEANGSTILLDEISEIDIALQAKLLRAIQERTIDRVGGKTPIKLDIRIIATSNRDLQEEIKHGHFREDLFFRLNIINLDLAPLKERPEDIRPLVEHFAQKYAQVNGLAHRKVTPQALSKLEQYAWPGNVRELENSLHRAVVLAKGDAIEEEDILLTNTSTATEDAHNTPSTLVGRTVESVEQELILNTVGQCLGNRTQAATILGISIRTLRNKLKAYSEAGADIPESLPQ